MHWFTIAINILRNFVEFNQSKLTITGALDIVSPKSFGNLRQSQVRRITLSRS